MALRRPVSVLILTVVMTLAAYTSTKIGTISRINLPTTSGFPRNISVRSGDSLFGGVGSSASCGLSAGVGVAVSDAGPGVAVVEDDGVDTPSACICVCCAWRAAARSAFAFALIILPRVFSVYVLWSYTPSQSQI